MGLTYTDWLQMITEFFQLNIVDKERKARL